MTADCGPDRLVLIACDAVRAGSAFGFQLEPARGEPLAGAQVVMEERS